MKRRWPLIVMALVMSHSALGQRAGCLDPLNLGVWDIGFTPIPDIPIPPEPSPGGFEDLLGGILPGLSMQRQESPSTAQPPPPAPSPDPIEPSDGRSLLDQAF